MNPEFTLWQSWLAGQSPFKFVHDFPTKTILDGDFPAMFDDAIE